MEKKDQEATSGNEPVGRISKQEEGKERTERADISHVDRQEGEMDHGETGGNFKEDGES